MSMKVAHSFHLSTQKSGHTCSNVGGLKKAQVHNTRKFRKATNPNLDLSMSDLNLCLVGTGNLINDVKEIYQQEFSNVLENYNMNKKPSRQIEDYFEHINKSERYSLAEEIIIQFGSKDDIANIDFSKQKNREQITKVYQDYIDELNKICPDFKVANARVHFDETTPHMHVVGVPVGRNYKTGMEKQVAKTRVFTKESLRNIQSHMGKYMINSLNQHMGDNQFELYEPKQGRNRNFTTKEYNDYKIEIKALERKNNSLLKENKNLKFDGTKLDDNIKNKSDIVEQLEDKIQIITKKIDNLAEKEKYYDHLNEMIMDDERILETKEEQVKEKLSMIEKHQIKKGFNTSATDLQAKLNIGFRNLNMIEQRNEILRNETSQLEQTNKKLEYKKKELDKQLRQKELMQKTQLQIALEENRRLQDKLAEIEIKTKEQVKKLFEIKGMLEELINIGKITIQEIANKLFKNSDESTTLDISVNIDKEVIDITNNKGENESLSPHQYNKLINTIRYEQEIQQTNYYSKSKGMRR